MSRSYRKFSRNKYNLRDMKIIANRSVRRKFNRGEFDEGGESLMDVHYKVRTKISIFQQKGL